MKQNIDYFRLVILVILFGISTYLLGELNGKISHQNEIEKRAIKIFEQNKNKLFFTKKEIEIIIFGETQE